MKPTKRLLIIGIESHYQREVLRGIHHYCGVHGRWEYHWEGSNSEKSVKRAEAACRQWRPDGIIAHVQSKRVNDLVEGSGTPAVNVSGIFRTHLPTVISDYRAMGRMAARHFLENGFRHFGFFHEGWEHFITERIMGFQEELRHWGENSEENFELFANRTPRQMATGSDRIRKRLDRWLAAMAKPAAITCMNDTSAQEVVLACRRVGIVVPDEIGILGMGNQEMFCRMITPPLSSVAPASARVGYEAARLVDRLIRGLAAPKRPVLIEPSGVVARQSSDFVAINDLDIATAMRFIRDHAHEAIGVKDVLGVVPMSRKTLERRFAELVGHTPSAEIVRVRLERVKGLLEQGEAPIKEVIRSLGFGSRRAFSLFFRREMGMTPGEYRRRRRGERA